MLDKEIESLIEKELERQNSGIELIASENYPSKEVMKAQGSILTAKYAEGYPGKRYYGGCEIVDQVEGLAISRAKEVFGAEYANVQPHSGSQANFAAYRALLPGGGRILSLDLNDGGHLTHGSPVSFSSHLYSFSHYALGNDGRLAYDSIRKAIDENKPDLLLAGFSAYPFEIDFAKLKEICDEQGAKTGKPLLFMVDMAHIAGLVAAREHMSPLPYADVVTSTTHKTLRGPRGGLILSRRLDLARKLDSAVFPYSQGGPLEHVIAAKAVCFLEAMQPSFREYIKKVKENTLAACLTLKRLGAKTSGTENHLFLLNVLASYRLDGKEAQNLLESIGITTNKNMIHGDSLPPSRCSGLRIGFAAATTRGCTAENAVEIATVIDRALKGGGLAPLKEKVKSIVAGWKDISDL